MNILLTGATGFVGSHLLKALLNRHFNVTVIKRSFSNCVRIKDYINDCTIFDLDTTLLSDVFWSRSFDVVIHCATSYGGDNSSIKKILDANLVFSLNLLSTAILFKCPYFINTDSFFTKQLPSRLLEDRSLYRPEYTLSKYQFTEWGKMQAIEKKVSFINLKMEHIYGPDDGEGKFIPYIIGKMKSGSPTVDLTDGTQVRDFIYVGDVVQAYLAVLNNLSILEGYHNFEVGTGKECTMREFVEKIRDELCAKTQLNFGAVPKSDAEIAYSVADARHLQDLGWQASQSDNLTWVR